MTTLVGLSGSLRQGSFNSALLRAAVELMPAGVELSIGSIRGIPLYDGDVEAREGVPEAVQALKDAVARPTASASSRPNTTTASRGVQERHRLAVAARRRHRARVRRQAGRR